MLGRRFPIRLRALLAVFVLASVNAFGAVQDASGALSTGAGVGALKRPTLGPGPVVTAAITGQLKLCARHAPGRCRVGSFRVCGPVHGCFSVDRVRIVDTSGAFAGARLRHRRFSVIVAHGHYTVELLEDRPRVSGRVLESRSVTARRYGVAHLTFRIDVT